MIYKKEAAKVKEDLLSFIASLTRYFLFEMFLFQEKFQTYMITKKQFFSVYE